MINLVFRVIDSFVNDAENCRSFFIVFLGNSVRIVF